MTRRLCLSALPAGLASLPRWGRSVGSWFDRAQPGGPVALDRQALDPADAAAGAEAVRAFTAEVYRDLARTGPPRGNLVCSPYSAAVALAMARAGARGRTASEIDSVLHAPSPRPRALDAGLHALDQLLCSAYSVAGDTAERAAAQPDQVPRLATANALWIQSGLAIEAAFRQVLSCYYNAGEHEVDFRTATEDAREAINTWVSGRTSGKIPELLAPGAVTPDTSLVLTNAIHLKASWRYPFAPTSTVPAQFRLDSGESVTVPMMASPANLVGYASCDAWQAVSLPYAEGAQPAGRWSGRSGLAMAVVVPKPGGLAELERGLDEGWLRKLLTGFTLTTTRVRLPRWTFRLPVELGGLLARLGMPTAFTAEADFTGISAVGGLRISRVVHEAFIAVDEKGTEAAAATAVVMERAAGAVEIVADRPFLYVIYDVATVTPLFIGRVTDPTAQS